jgi:hypothetical protein
MNLILHIVCLAGQVLTNFALLETVHAQLAKGILPLWWPTAATLPAATALVWGASLAMTPSPVLVRCGAVGSIAMGYAARAAVVSAWVQLLTVSAVFEATVFVFYRTEVKHYTGLSAPPAVHFGLRAVLGHFMTHAPTLRGCAASPPAVHVCGALFVCSLAVLSSRPFVGGRRPPPRSEFLAIALGWAVALAMDQSWVFFVCCGQLASAMQGVAHRWTREMATLPGLATHADELGHATFFPCLLLHAVYDSALGQ